MGWDVAGLSISGQANEQGNAMLRGLRVAIRSLTRRPGYALTLVLTLALGIGSTATMFSVIDAILIRDLPYPEPGELFAIWETDPGRQVTEGFTSWPTYVDLSEQVPSFVRVGAFYADPNSDVNLTGGLEPERVNVARVSPGYFETIGVVPALGRTFTAEENQVGNHRVAILSHGVWVRQFAADPALLGGTVDVNGFPYTVVGIMPEGFQPVGSLALGDEAELWRPLAPNERERSSRGSRNLRLVGRLTEEATLLEARGELDGLAQKIRLEDPEIIGQIGFRAVSLHDQSVGALAGGLRFLLGAVALVLLIACANGANLMLVRSVSRAKEISVRAALGAGRGQVVRHLLLESMLVALVAAAVGVALTVIAIPAVRHLGASITPLFARTELDVRVLLFTVGIAAATSLLFGLVPSLYAARADVASVLADGGRGTTATHSRRAADRMVVAEIAFTLMVLASGGLIGESYRRLSSVDPGFDHSGLFSFQLELPMVTKYPEQSERAAFFGELRRRLGEHPGIESTALTSTVPMGDRGWEGSFWFSGVPELESGHPSAQLRLASDEYFEALSIPVLEGRSLSARDVMGGERVAVISESMARIAFEGTSLALDQTVEVDGWFSARVVGVVGDVRHEGLADVVRPTLYWAADQVTYNFMTVVLRTRGEPGSYLDAVRTEVASMDPELPLFNVAAVSEFVERSGGGARLNFVLLASFALVALGLASIGVYGVMAQSVARRRAEMGVRMALGAQPTHAVRLVMLESGRLTGLGLLFGAIGVVPLALSLRVLLFGVGPFHMGVLLSVAGLLSVCALAAALVPALRAARVAPAEALRVE